MSNIAKDIEEILSRPKDSLEERREKKNKRINEKLFIIVITRIFLK